MRNKKILLELVWWIFTAVLVGTLLFPMLKDFPNFPFMVSSALFLVAAITFARLTFFLQYSFLAQAQYVKIAFVLVTFAICIAVGFQLQDFNVWLDENDPASLLAEVIPSRRENLLLYIRSLYLFSAVGAIVSALFLAIRLLISIWRVRNKQGV